ncbi:MAG: hypothetical protein MUF62_05850 [Chitinophagaceae bacterium]|jgi:hypothetical protein|nr:hypothetical protein [Chitinophagaceae bacterium]
MQRTPWYLLLAATLLCGVQACKKSERQRHELAISIGHTAGAAPLALGTSLTTPAGDPLTINVFRYYLSNFSVLYRNGGEQALSETYFLIDQAQPGSQRFSLFIPSGEVAELRFWVGVDSTRNVSGVQTGALDPANGMFWTWNSGYIFAKLEGRSAVSPAPLGAVTYHIGGFRTGQNALRQVRLALPAALLVDGTQTHELVLAADVMKWFRGATDLRIASDTYTMEPGPLALRVADNYARMFELKEVR